MIIRVIDFETTGIPTPDDPHAIVEIGWSDVEVTDGDRTVSDPRAVLVDPERPIPIEASAVHHITRDDQNPFIVKAGIYLNDPNWLDGIDVLAAHNAAFERKFWPDAGLPWICTYKSALRLWTNAPRHTNQVLRYWLDLAVGDHRAMPPHRAGPDAYVTALILNVMLGEATVDALIQWSSEPALLVRCGFGKHRGVPWSEVPRDYLDWIVRKSGMDDEDVLHTARHHLAS